MWLKFTPTMGMRGAAYFGRYHIETDQSYWPWNVYEERGGNYITRVETSHFEVRQKTLFRFELIHDTEEITVTRSYGKLDNMLSYIGGLFGLLFAVFFFFLEAYNEYCYELMVGESLFKHK